MHNKLTQKLHIKSLASSGKFTGYASVFNNIDSYNDVVLPGAFKNTNSQDVKLLWQHDPKAILGKIDTLQETQYGLLIEAELFTDIQQGQEVYKLMQRGVLDGLSIGYGILEEFFEDGLRYIKDLKLWEISLVTFPANEHARVINLKDDEKKLLEAMEQGIKVLRGSLKSIDFRQM